MTFDPSPEVAEEGTTISRSAITFSRVESLPETAPVGDTAGEDANDTGLSVSTGMNI